jgi:hypothetical protein
MKMFDQIDSQTLDTVNGGVDLKQSADAGYNMAIDSLPSTGVFLAIPKLVPGWKAKLAIGGLFTAGAALTGAWADGRAQWKAEREARREAAAQQKAK